MIKPLPFIEGLPAIYQSIDDSALYALVVMDSTVLVWWYRCNRRGELYYYPNPKVHTQLKEVFLDMFVKVENE